ncbi:hypothetical protein PAMC26510_31215 [Caballeronia sordidicola]|uniref:Uncharacterized protein n=1 Tax=Caballeronia sordidicola TaxID=196367 RepID=A0A242M851_CABSO|nr:hypothetical protein PAMC26510_31215 [Caballeronia sordidicola]
MFRSEKDLWHCAATSSPRKREGGSAIAFNADFIKLHPFFTQ